MWSPSDRHARLLSRGWLVLWVVLVVVALRDRPLLPVDETRYLSVAWEMWRGGDWLVPHLNGAPYSDKPPLLFWAMLLGWRVFGVSQWWPRLLGPLFALIGVFLLGRLVRRLAPDRPGALDQALPFLSGILWVTFSTLVLFDTLLTTCVLLALIGVTEAWRGRPVIGWLACGVGLGLGGLTKGPVVLVHVLPVALLAPWWAEPRPASWRRWYVGIAGAVALGCVIGFGWALTAAAQGGAEYRAAILWHQTAGRIANAFAHRRPWWWYASLLPLVLYPWALWPPLWRSLGRIRHEPAQAPVRFALAWVVPAMVALSLFSGKQIHYLMPLLPGFAVLAGATRSPGEGAGRLDALLPAALPAIAGLLLLAGPGVQASLGLPLWVAQVPAAWGLVLLAGALALALTAGPRRQVLALSLVAPGLSLVVHLAGAAPLGRRFDLVPVAGYLREAERAGRPIAHIGPYSGELHFLGRLEHPIEEVTPEQLPRWEAEHRDGMLIRHTRSVADTTGALIARPYGSGMEAVWAADGSAERAMGGVMR